MMSEDFLYEKNEILIKVNKRLEEVSLRLSPHHAHARTYRGKANKADKNISLVINVPDLDKGKFKAYKRVELVEYVYDSSNTERLLNIAKGIFNLVDTGSYVDLADADMICISPLPSNSHSLPQIRRQIKSARKAASQTPSKNAGPAEFSNYFSEQVSVLNGNGDGNSLFLALPFSNPCRIQIVLSLKIHPHIGRDPQSFFQSHSHCNRHRAFP